MKRPLHIVIVISVAASILVSCAGLNGLLPEQTSPQSVQSPAEVTPTEDPAAQLTATPLVSGPLPAIEPENATLVKQVSQVAIDSPYRLHWSSDSQKIGVMTNQGLLLYDANTLAILSNVMVQDPITMLDFSADSGLMATTADQVNLEVREIATGNVSMTINDAGPFMSVKFSPDGRLLAIARADDFRVDLWDLPTQQSIGSLTGFETAAPVYSFVFSPDARYLVWISRGTVQPMEVSNATLGPIFSYEDFVSTVAVSPDGRFMAVATAGTVNGTFQPIVSLGNPSSGQALGVSLVEQQQVPQGLSFSPSSRTLAVGAGNDINLLEISTRQPLTVLRGHSASVNDVAFSPDGRTLATTATDNTLRLWRLQP
ncbi:MAG: hypothetical protein GYA17_16415 [Chloroflexi bacterium]|jgi:WD40 repeat protein|nr:hypothetical protein [Anaerolineaceae bacterium]NMB89943.1 hypothetical protein [Chloroflexota bacterium]